MSEIEISRRETMNGKPVINAPVKTIINFESGFKEKLLCDGPTFSSGTSCAYSCTYCYVPVIMAKNANVVEAKEQGFKHEDVVIRRNRAVEIAEIQLRKTDGTPRFTDHKDTRVIYASPLVDVAANMELVRETVEICKLILSLTNWTIRLLSKSNLLTRVAMALEHEAPVGEWSSNNNGWMYRIIYGLSTGTSDDDLAKAIEPDCPLVSKRIKALHWLQDNGYRTFGMICPSLPPVDHKGCEELARDMAQALRYEKCEHVWAEVINVRGESMTRTAKALTDAGYYRHATELERVASSKLEWEEWARAQYEAHAAHFPIHKLRFLQYVNKDNIGYWERQKEYGAVLLGKAAHG